MLKNYIILLILFLNSEIVFSQVFLSETDKILNIGKQIYVYEDKTAQATIAEIVAKSDIIFVKNHKEVPNFGLTNSAIWCKITLENRTTTTDWLLEVGNPVLDSVVLYFPTDSVNYEAIALSYYKKFHLRPVKTPNFVFPLNLKPQTTTTVYLKIETKKALNFPLIIMPEQQFVAYNHKHDLVFGLYYGLIIVMMIYNLFLYIGFRDKSYLYYVLYVMFGGLTNADLKGTLFEFFLPHLPEINPYLPVLGALSGIFALFFIKHFLDIKKNCNKIISSTWLGILILYFLSIIFTLFKQPQIAVSIVLITTFLFSIFGFWIGIFLILKKFQPAKYYLFAWCWLLIGLIIFILMDFGVLPYNDLTSNAVIIGTGIEAIFLSLALANKINNLEKANQQIIKDQNTKLEKKVSERTKEIEIQKIELQEKNEELISAEEELRQNNEELLTLNDHLEVQKEMLEETLVKLQDSQGQLIQSEKMASLGGLVAGIAHELNTPVGIGITAASSLAEKINSFNILYKESKMKKSDLDNLVANTLEASQLILGNLMRTGDLIKSFKQVSVDQVSENKREFNFRTYMADVVKNLRPKLKHTNINIEIKCEEDLIINSYPGLFAQIITNFVINSLTHGFDEGQHGTITMRASKDEEFLKFYYSDNGKGLSQEVIQKICEPFFTTNKQKGTGLGMHIVFNLVTQKLNGELKISGQEGQGVKFFIKIPLSN